MPRITERPKRAVATKSKVAATQDNSAEARDAALSLFHPITAQWFRAVFDGPTAPQMEGWPAIARGDSTLILAPTGTGKTLTAFLWCLDRLMLRSDRPMAAQAETPKRRNRKAEPKESILPPGVGVRVVYISPLKALAVD